MRVARAEETKSWVDIRVSRGGFSSGEKEEDTEGGGLAQSSVIDDGSSVPRCFEAGIDF